MWRRRVSDLHAGQQFSQHFHHLRSVRCGGLGIGTDGQIRLLKSLSSPAEPRHGSRPVILSCPQATAGLDGLSAGQDGPGGLKQRIAEHVQLSSSTGSLRSG